MANFIKNYFEKRVSPRPYVFVFDIVTTLLSITAILLFFSGVEGFDYAYTKIGFTITGVVLAVAALSFVLFKTYSGVLRYSAISDLLRVFYALTVAYLVAYGVLVLLELEVTNLNLWRIISSMFFFNVFAMFFSRIFIKEIYERVTRGEEPPEAAFIYGTQQTGINIAKLLSNNSRFNLDVKGFITNDPEMVGKKLMGIDVYAYDNDIFHELVRKEVRKVVISNARFEDEDINEVVEAFIRNDVLLVTTDEPLSSFDKHKNTTHQLKEIDIEKLLPRPPIMIQQREVARELEGKTVMITGAAGSIGSEIVRQVSRFNPYKLVLVDQAETPLHNLHLETQEKWVNIDTAVIIADVSNYDRMKQVFSKTRPEVIYHAAAYKHVPMMEANVSEAVQNNVLGAKVMADLAVKYNVQKFVMVSTDKAVNPSNVMGASKRICEIYVQALAKDLEATGRVTTQFITTRFGNVLGSNGSVIPLFRKQIQKGGPITVTHPDIIRYFMTIPEACQLVLEAGSMGNGGEIYIFDMGKPVKIYDLAKKMVFLSGARDIRIEFTGLRHGEKLYEELLNLEECTIKTHHDKIMIAQVQDYEFKKVQEQVERLLEASYQFDSMKIVKRMKQLVPEFKSLNSPYEKIDKLLEKEAAQV